MEKELQKLIEKFGKEGTARMLGIRVRHLNNCLNGKHVGGPLARLIRHYASLPPDKLLRVYDGVNG